MTLYKTGNQVIRRQDDLSRIAAALEAAVEIFHRLAPTPVTVQFKGKDDPVTALDHAVNECLHNLLAREGEGWFSEETADDSGRLEKQRVWIVDPLDGTREFVAGIPEWCFSVGLVEAGEAVAGGVCNPVTGETFLGSLETGVTLNGKPVHGHQVKDPKKALILASRSEVNRGEWERFRAEGFNIRPVGSVAYKLACVAGGLADATWTLVPKHEWDVAAGVALVTAGGGLAKTRSGTPPRFNRANPLLDGLAAFSAGVQSLMEAYDPWVDQVKK